MKAVLIYNKSNQFGLKVDVEIVEKLLTERGVSIKIADPLEPPSPCDVAIHFEVPIYGYVPWAKTNYLLCNPEWYEDEAWLPYLKRFDGVIFRSIEARKAFSLKNPFIKTHLIYWSALTTSISSMTPQSANHKDGFVWFLGGSVNKRAAALKLVPLWKTSYPPLHIYTTVPIGVSRSETLKITVQDLTLTQRKGLAAFFPGHICISEAEGFGYTAAEAEKNGAFMLLNPLPVYKESYPIDKGIAWVNEMTTECLDDAIAKFMSSDLETVRSTQKKHSEDKDSVFLSMFDTFWQSVDKVVASKAQTQGQGQLPPLLALEDCPPISIITLLYNRRKFFDLACHNIMLSDYPKDKIEWIIVEDSDDPNEDASDRVVQVGLNAAPLQLAYMPLEKKTPIGQKRNLGIEKAKNDIILMMDDDDHLPETAIRRRVAWLIKSPLPDTKATACTTIACYDLIRGVSAVNTPPWNLPLRKRISEATLTFYKTWWKEQPFDTTSMAEGEGLLKGREQDLLEMPPQQILVAFSHSKNTSGSRQLPKEAKTGCFWGFPKEYLLYIHKLAGVEVEEDA